MVGTNDLNRSIKFYDDLLKVIGLNRTDTDDVCAGYTSKNGSGAIVLINNNIAPNILKSFDQRKEQNKKLELREYGVGAQILKNIGIKKIILLSNSNKKIIALDGFDIEIIKQQKI